MANGKTEVEVVVAPGNHHLLSSCARTVENLDEHGNKYLATVPLFKKHFPGTTLSVPIWEAQRLWNLRRILDPTQAIAAAQTAAPAT